MAIDNYINCTTNRIMGIWIGEGEGLKNKRFEDVYSPFF